MQFDGGLLLGPGWGRRDGGGEGPCRLARDLTEVSSRGTVVKFDPLNFYRRSRRRSDTSRASASPASSSSTTSSNVQRRSSIPIAIAGVVGRP